jgi:hypothetical protein
VRARGVGISSLRTADPLSICFDDPYQQQH